jgi:hypothetical protein
MSRALRAGYWSAAAALVVLCARSLAYALSPSPLASHFEGQAGGPALPVVVLVSIALALGLSTAIVWLAALGVAERRRLEPPALPTPGIRPWRLSVRFVLLFAAASLAFALFESYLHWRAGLGWHGLHCLTGPTHRDAIPLLGALSLVAAAATAAVEHVVAWMRRTIAILRAPRPRVPAPEGPRRRPACLWAPSRPVSGRLGARGPPLTAS